MTSKNDTLRNWYATVWEGGGFDAIPGFFVNEGGNSYSGGYALLPDFATAPEELQEWLTILSTLVTGIRVNILHTIEEGDWISAMLEITCQRCDTGADVTAYQQVSMRIVNGKIAESYPVFDFIRFFEQLGQLPPDTHALLLTGACLK